MGDALVGYNGSSVNPYLNRAMIRSAGDFYGRSQEIRRISARLATDPPQSVSVVGDRRIGKSSLLYRLAQGDATDPEDQALIRVFVDCQALGGIGVPDFLSQLAASSRIASDISRESAAAACVDFRKWIESISDRGRKLALFLDEFDSITGNVNFTPEFYAFLRSLANNLPVAYVTSSVTELQRLCCTSEISDSPFFNIFTNLYLKPFPPDEAGELIREPSRSAGHPLAGFQEDLLRLSGYFPLFLQSACSIAFEWLDESRPLDWPALSSAFLEEAEPHFAHFVDNASPEELRVVRRAAEGREPDPEHGYVCRRLVRRGYVRESGHGFELFSPLFADYVLSRHDATSSSSPAIGRGEEADLTTGSSVNQYRILRKAAEGGMGVIYQAEDTALGRTVALKFLQPRLLGDETTRRRLLLEARSAAALNHPAILTVHELFEFGDQVVMVMEWLDGRPIKAWIRDEGRVAPKRSIGWLIQVCDGLEEAHRRGIVHRDIKSSNLMVASDGSVKIADFGLAKPWLDKQSPLSDDLTREGLLLGTLDYMSPEQARAEEVDHRSDLFSLGVVLFEALTGKLPFHRSHPSGTLRAILSDPVPYLGLYEVDNADAIDRVLRRLLEKEPAARFQSAGEVRSALKGLLKRRGLMKWFD